MLTRLARLRKDATPGASARACTRRNYDASWANSSSRRPRALRRNCSRQQKSSRGSAGAPVRDPLKRPMNALSLECRFTISSSRLGRTSWGLPRASRRRAPPSVATEQAGSLLSATSATPAVLGAVGQAREAVAGLADAAQHAHRPAKARRGRRRGRSVGGPPQAEPAAGWLPGIDSGSTCRPSRRTPRAGGGRRPHHLADAHPRQNHAVYSDTPTLAAVSRSALARVSHAGRELHPRGRGQLRAGEPERAGAEVRAPPAQPPLAAGRVAALPHEGRTAAAPRAAVGLAPARGSSSAMACRRASASLLFSASGILRHL